MRKNKLLSEQDLAAYWESFSGLSDDGCEVSDAESLEDRSFLPESEGDIDSNNDEKNAALDAEEVVQESDDDDLPLSTFLPAREKKRMSLKNIHWKSKSLELNEDQLRFYGDTELSAEIMSLETPSQFFSFFFLK